MKIAVAGSRDGRPTRMQAVAFGRIYAMLGGTVILHGCCPAIGTPLTDGVPVRMRGVDAWIEERATARGIPIERFPPLQVTIGWPGCGPERSRRMVIAAGAVVCLPGGRGTERTRGFALDFGRPLYDIGKDGDWTGPCPTCGAPGDGFGCECCRA